LSFSSFFHFYCFLVILFLILLPLLSLLQSQLLIFSFLHSLFLLLSHDDSGNNLNMYNIKSELRTAVSFLLVNIMDGNC
jgi:hypothetical protein